MLLGRRPDCRFLVFDFRLVTGIDSSATHSFSQIRDAAAEIGARLVLVNLTREIERAFRLARFINHNVTVMQDLDRALESCEQAVVDAHTGESGQDHSLRSWLAEALGSTEYAERLALLCHRIDVAPGGVIAQQGDRADSMHFILEGRVGIVVDVGGGGRPVRVRSLGRHTTIGEMGVIARRPRSATIQAEIASVLYVLPIDAFESVRADDPALGHALLAYVIGVMAERLNFASRAIGVLQR